MIKLRTEQNRLVNILDDSRYPLNHVTALVVSEWRHYDAADEMYFQYLEILSDSHGLERYYRMISIDEAENFNQDKLIPNDLSVLWSLSGFMSHRRASYIIREVKERQC